MTSFVHLNYSKEHPGVTRVESALVAAQQLQKGFSGTRGLASLLLSAVAAAVMVVAYQVMDSVAEGHLLVMWIAMWAVAFAVLALFAGTARNLAARTRAGLDSWSRSMAEARADQRLWEVARSDPRVMADLQTAMTREEARTGVALRPAAVTLAAEEEPVEQLSSVALQALRRNFYV
ncbi:MAG: hypothetical protein ABIP46_05725 [Polaromonas sp.]